MCIESLWHLRIAMGLRVRSYIFIHLINQSKTNLRLQTESANKFYTFEDKLNTKKKKMVQLTNHDRCPFNFASLIEIVPAINKWKIFWLDESFDKSKTKEFFNCQIIGWHFFIYTREIMAYLSIFWCEISCLSPKKSLKISSTPPQADLSHSLKEKPVSTKHLRLASFSNHKYQKERNI